MKKLLMVTASAALVLALSACGSNSDSAAPASSPAASKAPSTAASSAPAAGGTQELVLTASAKTFTYDKPEYHVKAGVPLHIKLVNAVGIHGAQIQGLGINLQNNKLEATVTPKAGTYDIQCSVPCGSGHPNMKAKLIVE